MKWLTWLLLAVLIGIGVWVIMAHHRLSATGADGAEQGQVSQSQSGARSDGTTEQAIRAQVIAFGGVLQEVSLLSPTASADIGSVYAPYVTRSLLADWQSHPESALGRLTSSPWPDHIDVIDIEPITDGSNAGAYEVRAMQVDLTSNEVEHGGDAGSSELELIGKNEDNAWKVDSVSVLRENPPNTPRTGDDVPQPD